jgi:hypothetical protein
MLGIKANRYALFDDWKFGINDVSDDVFAELFDRLHEIFSLPPNSEKYPSRETFLEENAGIKEFFGSSDNKVRFLEKRRDLESRDTDDLEPILMVKDYYVALLHAFDANRQFPACYMISTSKKYEQALSFLRGKTKKDEGILIISWVPSSEQDRFLESQELNTCNERIKELGLPVYKSSPFPEQEEICVKAIIPPQYILGYIHTEKKIFVPNPNLVKELEELYDLLDTESGSADREDTHREIIESAYISDIISGGIFIDQSAFRQRFKETKFTGFAYKEGAGRYKESERDDK